MVKMVLTGPQKAAIMMLTLPPEDIDRVLDILGPLHTGRLRELMATFADSPNLEQLKAQVSLEFQQFHRPGLGAVVGALGSDGYISAADKQSYWKKLGDGSFGDDFAPDSEPTSEDGQGDDKKDPSDTPETPEVAAPIRDPIEELKSVDPQRLAMVLKLESPRTIAIVLNNLTSEKIAEIMSRLSADQKRDAFVQMAKGMPSNPILIQRIVQAVVDRCVQNEQKVEKTNDEKFQVLADILHFLDRDNRKAMLEALETSSPDTHKRVEELLFNFEDLQRIADRTIQKILTEVDQKTVAQALQGADTALVEAVLKNVSERVKGMIQEEMQFQSDLPPAKINAAKRQIVDIMRRYDKEGILIWKEKH